MNIRTALALGLASLLAGCTTAKKDTPWAAQKVSARSLRARTAENMVHLETEPWSPGHAYDEPCAGWSGDYPGRTILALVMEEKALGRKAKHLDEIMRRLPGHLNDLGYMGEPAGDILSEQQMAGNGWMLRALCAYARYAEDPVIDVRPIVERWAENLFLPGIGRYCDYPVDAGARDGFNLDLGGTAMGSANGWSLSSDVGCVFIGMDGLVDAWKLTGDGKLVPAIEEIVAKFIEMDPVAITAQTHATLTGIRALLRYDAKRFLADAIRLFDAYREHGMTDRYENCNLFCGYDCKWTEPCAIVDSMIIAHELHRLTGDESYAELYDNILYALLMHQMGNGGFTSYMTFPKGSDEPPRRLWDYEVSWCCTMRGGTGLAIALMIAENRYEEDMK